MKIMHGDLIKLAKSGEFDLIVHGCNCWHNFGAGIAKQIKAEFPSTYEADLKTKKGDISKLGSYSFARQFVGDKTFIVVNAYTQFNYSRKEPQADYVAIANVFNRIGRDFKGMRIGYPKIGAGLAGGNWGFISEIIDTELHGEDHTLVIYDA